ncbi:hypothetical protein MMC24_000183 [Lignoscripta atroalba]|nr:hypothetical protein [Lignoscripta atroalba]
MVCPKLKRFFNRLRLGRKRSKAASTQPVSKPLVIGAPTDFRKEAMPFLPGELTEEQELLIKHHQAAADADAAEVHGPSDGTA